MDSNQPSVEALNYHRVQARFSNMIVLAFLGILVAFTLYRVLAEWTLAQQYKHVAEYRESMERAQQYEHTKKQRLAELNFILGKDEDGKQLNLSGVAFRSPMRRIPPPPSSTTANTNTPASDFPEFHRRYSPFFKECKILNTDGKASAYISEPEEFTAQALASLADKALSDSPEQAFTALCQSSPLDRIEYFIPDSAVVQLNQYVSLVNSLERAQAKSSSPEVCSQKMEISKSLFRVMDAAWYPDSPPSRPEDYLTTAGCEFTPRFERDSRTVISKTKSIAVPALDRITTPGALFTEKDKRDIEDAMNASELRKSLEKHRLARSQKEAERLKDLNNQISKLDRDIESLRQLKPLSGDAAADRDKFGLHQLLLSALFVVSALTAAVTSSYMARAHSSEVIEIERQLRGQTTQQTARNPFHREPKTAIDMTPVKELIALLKGLKPPEVANTGSA